ncbi:hypothetical protein CJP74_06535 [Psittacicella melopsittaci]|uniref:phosphoglycolate phosphatase n=1 Tax=Psittacicella melopsittaci TaxID=2028576 RepID=A0A3A1Y6P5_9GAMM|nr:HAD-IA family hydrolase [Psittacicella melopsittaci]RIY31724.1 hypothetical protein CJP74_06535 [Psittacicella melopsittaci]
MTSYNYDLIVFDLDGTLLNTIEDIAHSYRLACKEFGFPEPPTLEVTNWVGQGHDAAVNECFAWLKRELLKDKNLFPVFAQQEQLLQLPTDDLYNEHVLPLKEQFKTRHQQLYIEVGNLHARLFPGVDKALHRLKATGVKLAVLTNKMKALTPKVLTGIGLYDLFDGVFSDGDLQHNKPHPEGILRHMENFGVTDKQRVLMVGDSENDINAGLAAHVQVLGLTYGYNYGKPIALANPTYVSDHFSAVVALHEGIPLQGEDFQHLVAELEA